MQFTAEQMSAIERRDGDQLLDASAGSGKTSVLVERFARAVVQDGVDVAAILTITFTDKAAAEMRDRIRQSLRELGAHEAARATEGAFISTIHGFCARLLRAHALSAGIDPAFTILDEVQRDSLAAASFDDALEDIAENAHGGVRLIAAYGPTVLRTAIIAVHEQLLPRGEQQPRLPPLAPAPDLEEARRGLERAASAAAAELGAAGQQLGAKPQVQLRVVLIRNEDLWDVTFGGQPQRDDVVGELSPEVREGWHVGS